MKQVIFFLLAVLGMATTGFADSLVLENQTSYPTKTAKMAIQWATSAQEVNAYNTAVMSGEQLDRKTMQPLTKTGQVTVSIPKRAEYFRVLIWSKGSGAPDLLTNWVIAVPDKSYTLQADHLVPTVLMIGMGC